MHHTQTTFSSKKGENTSAASSAAAATAVLPTAIGQATSADVSSSASNLSSGKLLHSLDSWLVRCSVAPTSELRDLASSDASLRNLELVPLVFRPFTPLTIPSLYYLSVYGRCINWCVVLDSAASSIYCSTSSNTYFLSYMVPLSLSVSGIGSGARAQH